MGVRALAPGQDQTEMVVSWADNAFPTAGPDDFAINGPCLNNLLH